MNLPQWLFGCFGWLLQRPAAPPEAQESAPVPPEAPEAPVAPPPTENPLAASVLAGIAVLDHSIDITGKDVHGCFFDGCIVALWRRPGMVTHMARNTFRDCLLVGDGWPILFATS